MTDSTKNNTLLSFEKVRIWDIWVRLFHWSLASCIVFLLVSGTTGWQFFEWHRTVGEVVLALLLFRLCWGIFGSSNARLFALIRTPSSAIKHLASLFRGDVTAERGHNAAGGWAVLAMLGVIAFQALSGLFIADEEELIEGVFYGVLSGELTTRLLHLHHANATLIKFVVLLHVVMIAIYAVRAAQNLIVPMLTGSMQWPATQPVPTVIFQRRWIGLATAVTCALAVGTILSWW